VHHLDTWIKRDQLDVTCFIISLFTAQHVSDVDSSFLRSLRLTWWVISWVVLFWFDVCWCYVVVWLGWCGIRMQAEAAFVVNWVTLYKWEGTQRSVCEVDEKEEEDYLIYTSLKISVQITRVHSCIIHIYIRTYMHTCNLINFHCPSSACFFLIYLRVGRKYAL